MAKFDVDARSVWIRVHKVKRATPLSILDARLGKAPICRRPIEDSMPNGEILHQPTGGQGG
jgi:hypothetical protein